MTELKNSGKFLRKFGCKWENQVRNQVAGVEEKRVKVFTVTTVI
jgi:hypothetical protein